MNWNTAQIYITSYINLNMHLDINCNYRNITDIPPFQCTRNGFSGLEGFRVRIGLNHSLDVPLEMLEKIHLFSSRNAGNYYNSMVFHNVYPLLRKNHPSYVQVVGRIFLLSHVARQINNKLYLFN